MLKIWRLGLLVRTLCHQEQLNSQLGITLSSIHNAAFLSNAHTLYCTVVCMARAVEARIRMGKITCCKNIHNYPLRKNRLCQQITYIVANMVCKYVWKNIQDSHTIETPHHRSVFGPQPLPCRMHVVASQRHPTIHKCIHVHTNYCTVYVEIFED